MSATLAPLVRPVKYGPAVSPLDRTAVVVDTFTRADNASSLGSTETGQAWTANGGTWGVTSGRAYAPSGTGPIATVQAAADGVFGSVLRCSNYATNSAGVIFRLIDANNYWRAVLFNGELTLAKADGGVISTPASFALATPNDTDATLLVEAYRDVVRVYVNGTQRISYTMPGADLTKYGAATAAGVREGGTAGLARFDNFRVTR